MPKMIKISAAEYERLQDCIREDGMRIAALIEENKALHQDAKHLTAVDAVPVVRCKECIHSEETGLLPPGILYCDANTVPFPKDGYCNRGKRKENAE